MAIQPEHDQIMARACYFRVIAVLLQCSCIALAMILPCSLHALVGSYHVLAMLSPSSYGGMVQACQGQGKSMARASSVCQCVGVLMRLGVCVCVSAWLCVCVVMCLCVCLAGCLSVIGDVCMPVCLSVCVLFCVVLCCVVFFPPRGLAILWFTSVAILAEFSHLP